MGKRGPSCGTGKAICFTVMYAATWILLLAGTLRCHIAVSQIIGPLQNLPQNIKTGFYDALKFDKLEASSASVKSSCQSAIHKCDQNILPTGTQQKECPTISNAERNTLYQKSAVTTEEKTSIEAEFQTALNTIKKVANDKYLGTADLQATANSLNNITSQLDQLPDGSSDCYTIVLGYCEIYKNADEIASNTDEVTKAIDGFYDNDMVKEYEERGDYLQGLHALPYFLVISMLCFCVFWLKDASCPSSDSGIVGSGALCCHIIFWLVFFIWNTIITAIGLSIKMFSDEIEIKGVLKGDPSIKDLIDHVEKEYPEFYDVVFDPLSGPSEIFLQASVTFELFCIIIVCYGCCVCCWAPYKDSNGKVIDASEKNYNP